MAYDPKTVEWKDEETSVENRMGGLLSKDSPYMQQAAAEGKRQANRRGLLNSTMAVTAVEDSRIRAALPIASQDASQANSRYMQGRDIQAGEMTQKRGLASNEALTREGYGLQRELQGGDIASRERMQGRDIAASEAAQGRDIASREGMQREGFAQDTASQQREIESRKWMQQFDAATQEKLQGVDLAARERMQQAGFTQEQVLQAAEQAGREKLQQTEQAGQQWLAQFDAQTREKLQTLDNETRMLMQQLDVDSQERIANMNVATENRTQAARLAASFELGYQGLLESLMNNPDIPADARQTYMDHANTMRNNNLNLVEQMYDIDLVWA